MKVIPFTLEHLAQVTDWYQKWKIINQPQYLSQIGFIIPGVIAAFLYPTNCQLGYVDEAISNPDINQIDRSHGLFLLDKAIELKAKELGITRLITTTSNLSLATKCERLYGWKIAEKAVLHLTKDLENE